MTNLEIIEAAIKADTWANVRRDLALVCRRGALRKQLFIRAHFVNRLACLKGNGTATGWLARS